MPERRCAGSGLPSDPSGELRSSSTAQPGVSEAAQPLQRDPGLRGREETSTLKGSHPPASPVEPSQGSRIGSPAHDVRLTMNVYTHVGLDDKAKAIGKLGVPGEGA